LLIAEFYRRAAYFVLFLLLMQIRNKYIRSVISCFLVLMAIWVCVPKVYIHELLDHDHSVTLNSTETQVTAENAAECEFEKFNKPAYFSIFKFISSFIPARPPHAAPERRRTFIFSAFSHAVNLLRAPPADL
jgi:hypothetical protein